MRYLLLLILCGCTTSYKHLSDPRIDNDGYNLVCGGIEVGNKLQASVDMCHNLSPNKGEFVLAEIQYNWSK